MDIVEFFEQSAGKWSSMRTSHHLAFKQQEGGKSTIQIELLEKTDPAVIQLCQMYEVDPETALCGARVTWDGTMEWDEEKHSGSTVLVPIADPENPQQGKLLREMGYAEKAPVAGRYEMAENNELTLITEYDTMYSKERLWFESPNVRLRHSILKRFGGFSMASFCSEVRMGGAKPDPQAADTATVNS
ncbi:phycobiliprotein lyase [Leptolyngbya sp. AN03gr2]|uniref:phycobiliprotein lyase n=1 Tax=unclassified Leptolyngbya TaxID=2650499 RepID=UPI003D32369E